jgi:hypothetical protein
MKVEVGKTYAVDHQRKGKFTMQVTDRDDQFIIGIVVSGTAKAMLKYNECQVGEQVCVRESFGKWTEQSPNGAPKHG